MPFDGTVGRSSRIANDEGCVRAFRELMVWKKAHPLTLGVFRATQRVKRGEFSGLVPQLRRAAASIPTNIAEGCGHFGQREFARFLQMAMASPSELEYLLLLATELGMLPPKTYAGLESHVKEVKRMLTSLIRRVRADAARETEKKRSAPSSRPSADSRRLTAPQSTPPAYSFAGGCSLALCLFIAASTPSRIHTPTASSIFGMSPVITSRSRLLAGCST